jgi:hypothetical protein
MAVTLLPQKKTRSPFLKKTSVLAAHRAPGQPAALDWEATSVPGFGRVKATGWLPAVLLAACAVALIYLVQTSGAATAGYDVQYFQAEQKEWELRNEQLRLELAKVQSLTWVENEAISRLHMVKPGKLTHIRVGTP